MELAFEWQRWNDLIRYGVVVNTMNNLGEKLYTCGGDDNAVPGKAVNYNMTQKTTVLPIPLTELQANPNLVQNDGY